VVIREIGRQPERQRQQARRLRRQFRARGVGAAHDHREVVERRILDAVDLQEGVEAALLAIMRKRLGARDVVGDGAGGWVPDLEAEAIGGDAFAVDDREQERVVVAVSAAGAFELRLGAGDDQPVEAAGVEVEIACGELQLARWERISLLVLGIEAEAGFPRPRFDATGGDEIMSDPRDAAA